eukprot:1883585-Alexandrium_andersonii.AAC.1
MAGWSTGSSPWIRSCSASIKVRINPLSCPTAFPMAPLVCGPRAGGGSSTVRTPKRSATAR